MNRYFRISCLSLMVMSGLAHALDARESLDATRVPLTEIMEPVLADLARFGVLGSAMAIKLPGRAPFLMSAGYVDFEQKLAMEPTRLFQIGSQTKMFTAAAILLLIREGKLSLDDPIADYVPDVTGSPGVTIEQLLTHTGGIGDSVILFDPPAKRPDYPVSLNDHLLLSRVVGQQFEAGTGWEYNNLGFIILGRIIEIASGQPLNVFVHNRLLQPLGMDSTWLGALEIYPQERMAHGFYIPQKGGELQDSTMPDLSWASSAGDMVSDLQDMLTWGDALRNADSPVGLTLDDFRRVLIATGSPGNMKEYALGMMGRNLNGRILWGHGGNIHGYVSLTLIDPDSGIVMALMTNLVDYPDDLLSMLESVFSIGLHLALLEQRQGEK